MTDHKQTNPANDRDLKSKAKETASKAAETAKARAGDAAENVAAEARGYADTARGAAADEVKGVASALRTAADEMRNGSAQERTFSQIADSLADASDTVRDKDLGEVVGAVSDFAKRNPMMFLGGAALLGFAATRFAKASGSGGVNTAGRGNDHTMDRPSARTGVHAGRDHTFATPAVSAHQGGHKV